MILHALKEYYDRKAADPDSGIAPDGFERKELQFLIVINSSGDFLGIEDTREKVGTRLVAKSFLLPRSKGRSGIRSYETTFLLWDHIGYLLGQPSDDEKSSKQHKTWLNSINSLPEVLVNDEGVRAIINFYKVNNVEKVVNHPGFQECLKAPQCNMSFRLDKDYLPVPCRKTVQDYVVDTLNNACAEKSDKDTRPVEGICIITGEYGEIVRTHSRTPINKDTKCLVGFQKNCGYDSYGKEQGNNAPIIRKTEFAYVTALNELLKSNRQRLNVGDDIAIVFWSGKKSSFENDFSFFFKDPDKDNPDEGVQKVKGLLLSAKTGAYLEDESDTKFYILGLSPNAARISVRMWHTGTISEFSIRIRQHFIDLEIVKPEYEPPFYSIKTLLKYCAPFDDIEKIPPNVAGDFMRSIFEGTPYPATLLQAVIRRIRSDVKNRVKPVRAALIKAYLNRFNRVIPNPNHKEILMSLDTSQPSTGYQLGRLFATLEKIQEDAHPGQKRLNATIRERFYGAACSAPVTVFANLMRLKNHHLAKIEQKGKIIFYEKLLSKIMSNFSDFPAHLDLHEQGRFAIGYYHQRQELFKPSKETETDVNN